MPARMLPVWPELVPLSSIPHTNVLAVVSFGGEVDTRGALQVAVPTPQLTPSPVAEVWRSATPVVKGESGEVRYARNDEVLFGTASAESDATEETAARLYGSILEVLSDTDYRHPLRVWNHVGSINADERGLERYKRFCAGRHEALTRRGFAGAQFPAASAVGMAEPGLKIYFLAARQPGLQVENPRQVSAYDYPRRYGPRSPSFARATVARWRDETISFISGTASVVGHETRHAGDLRAQLDETLENLNVIIGAAASAAGRSSECGDPHPSVRDLDLTKVYIRHRSDAATVEGCLRSAMPSTSILLVESEICRRDLLLEIEGVVRRSC